MFRTEDICSMSAFVRNASMYASRLRETRRPHVLTLNGTAEIVIQNAEAYQALMDRLEDLEASKALSPANAELEEKEGASVESEILDRLRREAHVVEESE
ncbi:MAG: type II toxin-antitoxin system Phd/YefM family antitoxin [Longimicrobiales bacterium]